MLDDEVVHFLLVGDHIQFSLINRNNWHVRRIVWWTCLRFTQMIAAHEWRIASRRRVWSGARVWRWFYWRCLLRDDYTESVCTLSSTEENKEEKREKFDRNVVLSDAHSLARLINTHYSVLNCSACIHCDQVRCQVALRFELHRPLRAGEMWCSLWSTSNINYLEISGYLIAHTVAINGTTTINISMSIRFTFTLVLSHLIHLAHSIRWIGATDNWKRDVGRNLPLAEYQLQRSRDRRALGTEIEPPLTNKSVQGERDRHEKPLREDARKSSGLLLLSLSQAFSHFFSFFHVKHSSTRKVLSKCTDRSMNARTRQCLARILFFGNKDND